MISLTDVFTSIFIHHKWSPKGETVSGSGSTRLGTVQLRQDLTALLKQLDVRTFMDAPCGDFNWMQDVDLTGIDYIGVDIVPQLVTQTREKYEAAGRRFLCADITRDQLPRADLILCRDCLVHLPSALILAALANLKRSSSTYLLATTFPGAVNRTIEAGQWRMLDLCAAPFNLPEPELYLMDRHAPGGFPRKRLGLWRLATITTNA